jgi:hypothetical protein
MRPYVHLKYSWSNVHSIWFLDWEENYLRKFLQNLSANSLISVGPRNVDVFDVNAPSTERGIGIIVNAICCQSSWNGIFVEGSCAEEWLRRTWSVFCHDGFEVALGVIFLQFCKIWNISRFGNGGVYGRPLNKPTIIEKLKSLIF